MVWFQRIVNAITEARKALDDVTTAETIAKTNQLTKTVVYLQRKPVIVLACVYRQLYNTNRMKTKIGDTEMQSAQKWLKINTKDTNSDLDVVFKLWTIHTKIDAPRMCGVRRWRLWQPCYCVSPQRRRPTTRNVTDRRMCGRS